MSSHDEAKNILFFLFCWFGHVSLRVYIGLYYDSLEPAEEDLVLYGKWAKKEANVISYFLMTSEWHPCFLHEGRENVYEPI